MMVTTQPFEGQHCETTATGTLLNHIGLELSEPILFGLGEGLSYIFWNMKTLDFPFIGGRVKPDILTQNIARNLGLDLEVKQTASQPKAWTNVVEKLDAGIPVGLKLDCFHLEYFSKPFHFAGHYAAMVGYDDQYAYLVDTAQQGSEFKTSLASLAKARSEKGPMSSRNLSYTIMRGEAERDLREAVVAAAKANAEFYLKPPISNVSYRGIAKTSKEVVKWFDRSEHIQRDFNLSVLMEKAGTGGSLFRNLYRDFLAEGFEITGNPMLETGFEDFSRIAKDWSGVIELFQEIAETQDRKYVVEVAELFLQLSEAEREAMLRLSKL
jgi:hypothetical protein